MREGFDEGRGGYGKALGAIMDFNRGDSGGSGRNAQNNVIYLLVLHKMILLNF